MGTVLVLSALMLLVLLWLWAIAPEMKNQPDFSQFQKFDYAHRGLHQIENGVPENSLRAFRLAADCGFGMELDLQLTKDNQVVVHHDATLKRSAGEDVVIAQVTYEELQQYRLFGTEEKIPLFSQLLELVDGKTPLIIELKGYNDPARLSRLTMEVLEGYEGLYCVESFDPRIVEIFRKRYPQVVRGQLMEHMKKGSYGLTGLQAFFARNLMTNFRTRPHFEAYDFKARQNFSLRTAKTLLHMQEVSWTLRNIQDFQQAKGEGNLCIFEHILPPCPTEEKQFTFKELLEAQQTGSASPVNAALRGKQRSGKAMD